MPGSGYFKTNYFSDMKLIDTRFRFFWMMVLYLGLVLFPFFSSSYYIHLINLVLINTIVALGLNIITGRAGIISLGHGGIFAAGAYVVAFLGLQMKFPFLLVLPATLIIGAILGAIMGLPSLRLRALYIVLGTMAMHFILVYLGKEYQSLAGHHWGISIPDPSIGPFILDTSIKWYPLLVIIVWLVTIFCINLLRSRVGRAWTAIGDRDFVALALGIHIGYYKILAFIFGSAPRIIGRWSFSLLYSLCHCRDLYHLAWGNLRGNDLNRGVRVDCRFLFWCYICYYFALCPRRVFQHTSTSTYL